MHRCMRRIGDPWLLVDHWNAPATVAVAGEMIEPRHRAVVDGESEAAIRLIVERKTDGRLDRAAMRDRNDILAGVLDIDAFDATADAVVEVHETFAIRRWLID